MKVISLGYNCYAKSMIQLSKYAKETDIFDWMNTFSFSGLIEILENKFDIFTNEFEKGNMYEKQGEITFYNIKYHIRMPHDAEYLNNPNFTIKKYDRRYERFQKYTTNDDPCEKYLFIRIINYQSPYYYKNDINEYTENAYNKIMQFIPKSSIIILLTNHIIPIEIKKKVYRKFILLDNVILPDFIYYGIYVKHRNQIIESYDNLFTYCEKYFSILPVKRSKLQEFISMKKIENINANAKTYNGITSI